MSDIKVTDRRMFTPDGRLREEFELDFGNASAEPAAAVIEPAQRDPEPETAREEAATEPVASSRLDPPAPATVAAGGLPASAPENPPEGLLELVEFLAVWALASMGEMPLPDGRLVRDLDASRFYIDLIGALQERWGPRLGIEEKKFLESNLDQLRLRYVSHRG